MHFAISRVTTKWMILASITEKPIQEITWEKNRKFAKACYRGNTRKEAMPAPVPDFSGSERNLERI